MPSRLSNVRSIRWSRACVSTTIVTSSGIRPSSTSTRMKSKSAFEADGKPTSISLKPTAQSSLNMRRLRSTSMGLMSAWLPSRRSTETQRGALRDALVGPGAVGQLDARDTGGTCDAASTWPSGLRKLARVDRATPVAVATDATDDYVHDCSPSRGGGGRQAGCAGSHRSSPPDHSERAREPQRRPARPRYAAPHVRAPRDPKDYRLPGFSRQPWGRGLGALTTSGRKDGYEDLRPPR